MILNWIKKERIKSEEQWSKAIGEQGCSNMNNWLMTIGHHRERVLSNWPKWSKGLPAVSPECPR